MAEPRLLQQGMRTGGAAAAAAACCGIHTARTACSPATEAALRAFQHSARLRGRHRRPRTWAALDAQVAGDVRSVEVPACRSRAGPGLPGTTLRWRPSLPPGRVNRAATTRALGAAAYARPAVVRRFRQLAKLRGPHSGAGQLEPARPSAGCSSRLVAEARQGLVRWIWRTAHRRALARCGRGTSSCSYGGLTGYSHTGIVQGLVGLVARQPSAAAGGTGPAFRQMKPPPGVHHDGHDKYSACRRGGRLTAWCHEASAAVWRHWCSSRTSSGRR
jgi:hypothetical protein